MTWNVDNVLTAAITGSTDMVFADTSVWVSTPTEINVYGYWDADANNEGIGEYYPNFYAPTPTLFLEDVVYVSGSPTIGGTYLVTDGTSVFSITATQIHKFDAVSRTFVESYTLPISINGKPVVGNGRIWFTDVAPSTDTPPDRQKLYYFDITGETFSAGQPIPTRKQFAVHTLAYDTINSWVIVANYNNSSVMKFNATTGAHVSTILVNRKPRAIGFSALGDLLVASKNGMITTVDLVAETYSSDLATYMEARSFADDGTHVWSIIEADPGDELLGLPPIIAGALARTEWGGSPYYDNFRAMTGQDQSYAISTSKFPTQNFSQLLLTPSFTYGSPATTVAPYIFLRNSTTLFAFRKNAMYRQNSTTIRATAMIATGPEAYFGETT